MRSVSLPAYSMQLRGLFCYATCFLASFIPLLYHLCWKRSGWSQGYSPDMFFMITEYLINSKIWSLSWFSQPNVEMKNLCTFCTAPLHSLLLHLLSQVSQAVHDLHISSLLPTLLPVHCLSKEPGKMFERGRRQLHSVYWKMFGSKAYRSNPVSQDNYHYAETPFSRKCST